MGKEQATERSLQIEANHLSNDNQPMTQQSFWVKNDMRLSQ